MKDPNDGAQLSRALADLDTVSNSHLKVRRSERHLVAAPCDPGSGNR